MLLSLRQLIFRTWSERHWICATEVTLLTLGELTFFAEPLLEVFVREHLGCKFVVGELLSSARTRAVESPLLQMFLLHDCRSIACFTYDCIWFGESVCAVGESW